jgi:hypothetical protein
MQPKTSMNKLVLSAMTTIFLTTAVQPFAIAAEADATASSEVQTLTLDNMQDVAYTLQRIHQQAINVYVEATRKHLHRFDLHIPSLATMPSAPLEQENNYLPLRKAWLAFFVGTMEPLVKILNEHLKSLDHRTMEAKMPPAALPEWKKIVAEWADGIAKLNTHLDVCANCLNDTKGDNVEVAKTAMAIDTEIGSMETTLYKAAKFLQDNKVGK